jgi:4-hydroxythreonine-4-phosphate dehydrogenase
MPHASTPVVLLTCGDPAGIGPEVVVKAWATARLHARARLRIVADAASLARVMATRADLPRLPVRRIDAADRCESTPEEMLVIEPSTTAAGAVAAGRITAGDIVPGRATAAGGATAAAAVLAAAAVVRAGMAQAIVTGPLHKEALHAAGYDVPGHTELLARDCGLSDDDVSMMLWLPAESGPGGLGVVHVTLHEPLARAVARITSVGIEQAGMRLSGLLEPLLAADRRPRIAVAALNPHGGEAGLFGDEERRIVAPAVRLLCDAGVDASGPLPADTLFLRAARGAFDGVVALYHDQGHIPVKLLGMHRAVNITLGLPFVRTSVAHGTAFDIVGTAAADSASMVAAIDAATRLVAAGWPLRAAAAPAAARATP